MSGLTSTTQTHPQNPPTTQRTQCFSGDPHTGSERCETGEPPQSAGPDSVAPRVLVQHHQANKADHLARRPGSTDTHLQLDPGFPLKQTTGGKAGEEGLCRLNGKHRNPAGLLPQPKTLLIHDCTSTQDSNLGLHIWQLRWGKKHHSHGQKSPAEASLRQTSEESWPKMSASHPGLQGTRWEQLSCRITVCYGNTTVAERNSLQRVIKTAERVIGSEIPSIDTIYSQCYRRRAQSILKDKHHPAHTLFKCWTRVTTWNTASPWASALTGPTSTTAFSPPLWGWWQKTSRRGTHLLSLHT